MRQLKNELDVKILDALALYREGASLQQISESISVSVPRRSLQRRLANLAVNGKIILVGERRGAKYFLKDSSDYAEMNNSRIATDETRIHFSASARQIQLKILRPLNKRKQVPYHKEFLTSYVPNKTSYLDKSSLLQLQKTGLLSKEKLDTGTYSKDLYQRLLIDLSWNSSRLEGNTYSLLETKLLIEGGKSSPSRNSTETQMILNHKAAIEFLITNQREIGPNTFTILNIHALLSENLLSSPAAEGRLRNIAVGIGGSSFRPLAMPQLIQQYFEILLKKAAQIKNPFEQSFFLMVQLPYLQPFEDVNKRVSRLAANIPFIKNNLSPISFVDVSDKDYIECLLAVYELNDVSLMREVFVWAYQRSAARYAAVRQSLGEPDPFKLKYRIEIKSTVAKIIKEKFNRNRALAEIQNAAKSIPMEHRKQFSNTVETELIEVHEGNFAKFGVRPSEFKAWKSIF